MRAQLEANVARNDLHNVEIHPQALAEQTGEVDFYPSALATQPGDLVASSPRATGGPRQSPSPASASTISSPASEAGGSIS